MIFTKTRAITLALLSACLLIVSCTPGYRFKVDAIRGGGEIQTGSSFYLVSGNEDMRESDLRFMEVPDWSNLVPFRFLILSSQRTEVGQHLEGQGIQTRSFFCPLHLQPKLNRSRFEDRLKPGKAWVPVDLPMGSMGVLICLDFLYREGEAHRSLVATNWIRTVAWTVRGAVALWLDQRQLEVQPVLVGRDQPHRTEIRHPEERLPRGLEDRLRCGTGRLLRLERRPERRDGVERGA